MTSDGIDLAFLTARVESETFDDLGACHVGGNDRDEAARQELVEGESLKGDLEQCCFALQVIEFLAGDPREAPLAMKRSTECGAVRHRQNRCGPSGRAP